MFGLILAPVALAQPAGWSHWKCTKCGWRSQPGFDPARPSECPRCAADARTIDAAEAEAGGSGIGYGTVVVIAGVLLLIAAGVAAPVMAFRREAQRERDYQKQTRRRRAAAAQERRSPTTRPQPAAPNLPPPTGRR